MGKNKEGRSRISTQDRKIASAVIRKARRKTKAKSPKKQTELETTEKLVENKEEGKMPVSEKKEADMSSMPVLEEEVHAKYSWRRPKSLRQPQKCRNHYPWTGTPKALQKHVTA